MFIYLLYQSIRHIQNNSSIFNSLFFQKNASISSYQDIFTHVETLLGIASFIQAYSVACVILANSRPGNILSPDIFRIGIFRTLPQDIIQPYSGIFRNLCNACIYKINLVESWNPEYSEPFHNYIPTHIQSPIIFTKICEYSKLRIFKILHLFRTISKI